LEVNLATILVSVFVITITAPAITPPEASRTVPRMVPRVSCANATTLANIVNAIIEMSALDRNVAELKLLVLMATPVGNGETPVWRGPKQREKAGRNRGFQWLFNFRFSQRRVGELPIMW